MSFNEIEVDILMRQNHMVKLLMRNKPAWADEQKQEVIEYDLSTHKYKNVWIKQEGTEYVWVYDQPPGKHIAKILEAIQPSKPAQEMKQEEQEQKTEQQPQSGAGTAIMPKMLTVAMLDDEKFSFKNVFLQAQRTADMHIKHRPGRGKQEYAYVDGNYIKQVLNLATKWQWSNFIDGWKQTDTEVICWGRVCVEINGKMMTQSAVGQADIHFKKGTTDIVCLGDDYKAAHTDMIKKATSQWGIAHDVYSGECD